MVVYSLNIKNKIYEENVGVIIKEIYSPNYSDIQKTIDNFNSLYTWDMMFTTEEVKKRMSYGDRFFIFYLKNKVVGHSWSSKRHLPHPHIYIYNVFVDKTKHNKNLFDSAVYVSTLMSKLSEEGYTNAHLIVDDWHKKAQTFFERMGFKQSNWLTLQDV